MASCAAPSRGFGSMHGRPRFGEPERSPSDVRFARAVELGVNPSTPRLLRPFSSERIIKQAMLPTQRLVIATKPGYAPGREGGYRSHPAYLRERELSRTNLV